MKSSDWLILKVDGDVGGWLTAVWWLPKPKLTWRFPYQQLKYLFIQIISEAQWNKWIKIRLHTGSPFSWSTPTLLDSTRAASWRSWDWKGRLCTVSLAHPSMAFIECVKQQLKGQVVPWKRKSTHSFDHTSIWQTWSKDNVCLTICLIRLIFLTLFSDQDTAELFFEDLRVPNSALLGKENHGFYYLMDQLPQERVGSDSNTLWPTQQSHRWAVLWRGSPGQRRCLSWPGTGWERGKLLEGEWQTCRRWILICVLKN